MTNAIFKQEMRNLYAQKSVSRDALVQSARSAMEQLVHEMQTGVCDSPEIAARISALAKQLQNEHGKMQYGYLKPRLKTIVDGIADELERVPSVAECYRNWLTLRMQFRITTPAYVGIRSTLSPKGIQTNPQHGHPRSGWHRKRCCHF